MLYLGVGIVMQRSNIVARAEEEPDCWAEEEPDCWAEEEPDYLVEGEQITRPEAQDRAG